MMKGNDGFSYWIDIRKKTIGNFFSIFRIGMKKSKEKNLDQRLKMKNSIYSFS